MGTNPALSMLKREIGIKGVQDTHWPQNETFCFMYQNVITFLPYESMLFKDVHVLCTSSPLCPVVWVPSLGKQWCGGGSNTQQNQALPLSCPTEDTLPLDGAGMD